MSSALPKLDVAALSLVLERCELTADSSARLDGCRSVSEALHRLIEQNSLLEAARLLAYGLPKREAVWWCCMCAAHTTPSNLPGADRKAAELTREWVRKQTDEARRAAMAEAKRAGYRTPEAWAAAAAFFCGDSLTAPDLPKVPPAAHLPGLAVAGAVVLASVRDHPERQGTRLARFLDSARDIARGGPGHLPREEG